MRVALPASRSTSAAAVALLVGLAGGGAAALHQAAPGVSADSVAAQRPASVLPPRVAVVGAVDGVVPWEAPLTVSAVRGAVTDVEAVDPDGQRLAGSLTPTGAWRSADTLVPAAAYRLRVAVVDLTGRTRWLPLVARTTAAERVVSARLSPGDDAVVGVGKPVVVDLDLPVAGREARAALERRLTVRTTPAVVGAWRWLSDTTLHWRPETYWPTGTTVQVRADLHRLQLPDGTWGSGVRTTAFRIGQARVSTVDLAAKTMTVRHDGRVVRVMKASMGNEANPTRGGVHLVLEKDRERVMDSATVGLPGEYLTRVDWAVRLSYSGTFTHSAPWSVRDQGVRNVSHGCVNLSPADARWFFEQAQRGDVVEVVNAVVGPELTDPGAADWNLPYDEWRQGSALARQAGEDRPRPGSASA